MTRHINATGLGIVKRGEGLRLETYFDIAGIPTIGYGHAGARVGERITLAEAEALLRSDLAHAEDAVDRLTYDVSTSDNQFSAMVSLAFNIGTGAFRTATALKMHRGGFYKAAAEAFVLWDRAHVEGRLIIVEALLRRRSEEAALYLLPQGAQGQPARTPSHRADDPDNSAEDLNRAEWERVRPKR